jgi:hypothetical protein
LVWSFIVQKVPPPAAVASFVAQTNRLRDDNTTTRPRWWGQPGNETKPVAFARVEEIGVFIVLKIATGAG